MAIEIDIRIPPCGPVTEVAEFAAQCEEAGFDGVGILDSQMLERDVFVSMAFAAQATRRIRISSAVINPVTRHISVLASAAKTVAELAPGRGPGKSGHQQGGDAHSIGSHRQGLGVGQANEDCGHGHAGHAQGQATIQGYGPKGCRSRGVHLR